MPEVRPFRACAYHSWFASEKVLSPPYDVISPEEKEYYLGRGRQNIVRVILPESPEAGGETLRRWCREGVLVDDPRPGYYWCEQEYRLQEREFTSAGLIALLRLDEGGRGGVLPHEDTIPSVRQSQLDWLRSVRANATPIMILYRDRMKTVEALVGSEAKKKPPVRTYRDREGVRFSLWKVSPDPEIAELFDSRGVFIADGHHRFASAQAYHAASGRPGAGFIMAYFLNSANRALQVFSFHRVLSGAGRKEAGIIREKLALEEVEGLEALGGKLNEGSLGFGFDGRFHVFSAPEGAGPAVHYLHREILTGMLGWEEDRLAYEMDTGRAFEAASGDSPSLVFFLPPVSAALLHEVWKKGLVLPRKSTCFYPKIPSGLVMYRHDGPACPEPVPGAGKE